MAKFDTSGNLYFVDVTGLRKIDTNGILYTVVLTSTNNAWGDGGDNYDLTYATISTPKSLFFDSTGKIYVSSAGCRLRLVNLNTSKSAVYIIYILLCADLNLRSIFLMRFSLRYRHHCGWQGLSARYHILLLG